MNDIDLSLGTLEWREAAPFQNVDGGDIPPCQIHAGG
jgi:hypothetical protein